MMGELRINITNMPDSENDPNPPAVETVVITGFGAFSVHKINPSWEVAKELKEIGLGEKYSVVIEKLEVDYKFVDESVPRLWEKHKPKLVVHCGVSGIAKHLTLENLAHRNGYESKDVNGCLPHLKCCHQNGPDILSTRLCLGNVCEDVNSSNCGVTAVISKDPGRYLCDYTFYKSLSINPCCSAFIHVPLLNSPYSVRELAVAIKLAILSMLKQLDEKNNEESVEVLQYSVS